MLRLRLLTIPCVTDRSSPSGLPTAKTASPALTSSPLPRTTWLGFRSAGSGSLSKSQIEKRVQGDDLDVLDPAAGETSRHVHVKDRRDPGLALDHVGVGDRVALLVDDETRPLPDGVSIEMTASPNLPTSSLTGEGFKTPVV